jgi:hypothetical protein
MRSIKYGFITAATAVLFLLVPAAQSHAQVSVEIGVEPSCPYGYYDVPPYECAPDGYYGPEWFNGGVFIGSGRWFHGPSNFHGHVNNHFDPQHGYKGAKPEHGPAQAPKANFKGNESRDGRGHGGK